MTRPKTPKAASRGPEETDDDFLFAAHPDESIDASYVIGRAFELILERPGQVIKIAAASALLSYLLLYGLVELDILNNSVWQAAGIGDVMHPASVIALLLIGWAAALLLQAPLIGSAIEVHTDGQGLFTKALKLAIARLPRLLVASAIVTVLVLVVITVAFAMMAGVLSIGAEMPGPFLQTVIVGIGALLIIYVAFRAIAGFSLLVPVTLVEDLQIGDAIRRSWALGWRNGWAIVWALMLPSLLVQGVMFVASYMPTFIVIGLGVVFAIGLALYNTVVIPVSYVAIREYVDGLHPGRLLRPVQRRRG